MKYTKGIRAARPGKDIRTLTASGANWTMPNHYEVGRTRGEIRDLVKRSMLVAKNDPWEYVGFIVPTNQIIVTKSIIREETHPREIFDTGVTNLYTKAGRSSPDHVMVFVLFSPGYRSRK